MIVDGSRGLNPKLMVYLTFKEQALPNEDAILAILEGAEVNPADPQNGKWVPGMSAVEKYCAGKYRSGRNIKIKTEIIEARKEAKSNEMENRIRIAAVTKAEAAKERAAKSLKDISRKR